MAEGNKVGRPPKYKSKKEIERKIEDYFTECQGIPFFNAEKQPLRTDKGVILYEVAPKPPTVTGLALALGFSSRQGLLNYQGKEEFQEAVLRAKARVEEYAESRLYDREGLNGAKFNLMNNFRGWSDRAKEEGEEAVLDKLDRILEGIDHAAES